MLHVPLDVQVFVLITWGELLEVDYFHRCPMELRGMKRIFRYSFLNIYTFKKI